MWHSQWTQRTHTSPSLDFVTLSALAPQQTSHLRIWQLLPELFGAVSWQQPGEFLPVFPGKTRLCLVMIDGMGLRQLQARRGHLPFLRSKLAVDEDQVAFPNWALSCVPSTTTAALSSLHTGKPPGITGMLGYQCWDPLGQQVVNLITFTGERTPVDPTGWCQEESFFTWCNRQKIKQCAIVPAKFIGSGMSQITLRDARCLPAKSLADRVENTISAFKAGFEYVYLYWSDLDHRGHNYGWESESWTREIEGIDRGLAVLYQNLPPDVLLVVTADHGMVDVDSRNRIDLARGPLADQIVRVAGEPRALHLHLKSGSGRVEDFQSYYQSQALVVADHEQVYGPVAKRDRLGDLTLFARENYAFVDSRWHSRGTFNLVGVHGSLTHQEMEIPLLIWD